MTIDLRHGDCLEVLKTLPDNSVDSVITDPPYGIGFMNKEWDNPTKLREQQERDLERAKQRGKVEASFSPFPGQGWKGVKEARWFQEWCELWAVECLRVLKPGGHILSFSAPRMYHRMATAFEDAGFEIRDQLMWVFGSGFPKSHNIGKAIDKIEGNDRDVVGDNPNHRKTSGLLELGFQDGKESSTITKGYSDWEGWGTALKPAHEPIVMARKPLSEKSIAENVLKHGTGGINIDGSRIGTDEDTSRKKSPLKPNSISYVRNDTPLFGGEGHEAGRFPANIIFDEEAGQLLDEQSGKSKTKANKNYKHSNTETELNTFTGRGTYTPREDEGGASRFFYCPKAAKKDRNEGLDGFEEKTTRRDDGQPYGMNTNQFRPDGSERKPVQPKANHHPTVKPTDLMRYLINLVTPNGGTTLDPFMGSGSTGKAAVRCGVNFIGIEKEQEYMDIAKARIEHEKNKPVQGKLL